MAKIEQKIVPHLWFDKEAREAAQFYTSLFEDSCVEGITTLQDTPSGTVDVVSFRLSGQEFKAISGGPFFHFNESISLIVRCDTQEEVDFYWEKLSGDGGEQGVCGWLKDKYGLSWQIVPAVLDELMGSEDPERTARVGQAILKMKKLDIAALQSAYDGDDEG